MVLLASPFEIWINFMGKDQKSKKVNIWAEAKKKYRLTPEQIQMARELGLNPKKFGGMANHKQEPWKEPLPQYIETLYFKHFRKEHPDKVIPLDESSKDSAMKDVKRANKSFERERS